MDDSQQSRVSSVLILESLYSRSILRGRGGGRGEGGGDGGGGGGEEGLNSVSNNNEDEINYQILVKILLTFYIFDPPNKKLMIIKLRIYKMITLATSFSVAVPLLRKTSSWSRVCSNSRQRECAVRLY